ncbi:N-acetylglucosamine-6-phosphate deacetylase [Leucobacter sp. GX0328]
MLVTAARVVTSARVLSPGWIEIAGDRIVAVGEGEPAQVPAGAGLRRDLGDVVLVPGFVDIHVHGGGGGGYTDGLRASALTARAAHLAHGTTTSMASLVTASPEGLLRGVGMLAELAPEHIRGIHLEGPWLSPARAGAHDTTQLRAPEADEIDRVIEAAGGALAMVTLAPELPGALDAVRRFVAAGVRVAVGHTDADYDTTRRAIDAGATVATHLCNAMRPLHHREPGPSLALLEDPRVFLEVIADGTHLHPALTTGIEAAAGPERTLYVTDAMDAAACADGEYRLGALDVTVANGVARLTGKDTIAGSTATMDALFRGRALRGAEGPGAALDPAALVAAARLTATAPARAMGWDGVGDLASGLIADAVVLGGAPGRAAGELAVLDVLHRGRWLSESQAEG